MKRITLKVWAILLSLCVFSGANAQQFLDETETCDIVRVGTWMPDGGMDGYAMADVEGVVTIVEDTDQGAAKWYRIPAGEFEGMQAYYYKNVGTNAYLIPGEQVEDGGDWRVRHAITGAKNADAKWVEVPSRWGEGVYLASVQGFVTTDYEDASKKPFVSLGFFTMSGGNVGDAWGVQGPAAAVMSPGPGAGNETRPSRCSAACRRRTPRGRRPRGGARDSFRSARTSR